MNLSAILEVLEEGGHGHTRAAKDPRAADLVGIAFDRFARCPDIHGFILNLGCYGVKARGLCTAALGWATVLRLFWKSKLQSSYSEVNQR